MVSICPFGATRPASPSLSGHSSRYALRATRPTRLLLLNGWDYTKGNQVSQEKLDAILGQMLTPLEYLLIALAAGTVNALAGGGTLITFPLLTLLGIPPPQYRLPYISTDPITRRRISPATVLGYHIHYRVMISKYHGPDCHCISGRIGACPSERSNTTFLSSE